MLSLAKWKLLAIIAGVLVVLAGAVVRADRDNRPEWNARQRATVRSMGTVMPDKNYLPK